MTAKKAATKKTTAKKAASKKTTAKKAVSKKTAAKKTVAKKAVAKKTAAKKTVAKEALAENVTEKAAVKKAGKTVVTDASGQPVVTERLGPDEGRWNPNIFVFACNWCSYAGADTAGISRIQHQPHFRTVRVMCSGRVHPGFVLRALEKGADGVLVSGCHIGDCHYISGNERQLEHFEITKRLVHLIGLEPGRVRLEWISAAEGPRWAKIIDEFTNQIRALGPSPLKGEKDERRAG